jgi:hypothetical protein
MPSQADVDAILTAMVGNVLQVHFADGRRVIYRSIPEMREALSIIRDEIAAGSTSYDNTARSTFVTVCRD